MENINKALLQAQKEMMGASKDAKNPFFKSKYATLNSVWAAAKEPLHNNGIVCLQPIDLLDGQQVVKTVLIHESGESIESNCPIICAKQNDPQAMGSAITYARRYSLASILGMMTDEDDDGEKAMARKTEPKKIESKVCISKEQMEKLKTMSDEDIQKTLDWANIKMLGQLSTEQAAKIIKVKGL